MDMNFFSLPSLADQSVTILHQIFGQTICQLLHKSPNNPANGICYVQPNTVSSSDDKLHLIPHFLLTFNSVLLTAIIFVYAVILFVGTLNTANDGQFLGRNWNSVWIPIRTLCGPIAVVPLKYGLCLAQYLILLCILWGVHLATTVWSKSIDDVSYKTPPTVPSYIQSMVSEQINNYYLAVATDQIIHDWGATIDPSKQYVMTGPEGGSIYDPEQSEMLQKMKSEAIQICDQRAKDLIPRNENLGNAAGNECKSVFNKMVGNQDSFVQKDGNSTHLIAMSTSYISTSDSLYPDNIWWWGLVNQYAPDGRDSSNVNTYYTFQFGKGSTNNKLYQCIKDNENFQDFYQNYIEHNNPCSDSSCTLASLTKTVLSKCLKVNTVNKESFSPNNFFTNINSTKNLKNSWWLAGESYLDIDAIAAKNIQALYKQVLSLLSSGANSHFGVKGEYVKNDYLYLGQRLLDKDSGPTLSQRATISQSTSAEMTDDVWQQFINSISSGPPNLQAFKNLLQKIGSRNRPYFFLLVNEAKDHGQDYQPIINLANLVINGADQHTSADIPVKSVMSKIFSHLLSFNSDAASGNSNGMNSIMQEIYQLGDTSEVSKSILGQQFSVIEQIQRTGLDMILSSVSSIESVYDQYLDQYNQLQTNMYTIAAAGGGASIALSVLGSIFGFGGGAGSASATVTQTIVQIYGIVQMTSLAMALMWLPVLMAILLAMFSAGVSFALLVPLTPYILYWAGQITWIIGAIEGVVAAPLLALAWMHPGGHDFMGHTVQGFKMLLGVVFRPALMVLGLLIGIVLTYIVIQFSAQGFHLVAASIIGNGSTDYPGLIPSGAQFEDAKGILAVIMVFVYASFIVLAFNKCFALIYILPEKVMQWIGGHGDRSGQEELQQLTQKTDQASQQAGQAGSQAANQGIQAQQQETQGMQSASGQAAGAATQATGAVDQGMQEKKRRDHENRQNRDNVEQGR